MNGAMIMFEMMRDWYSAEHFYLIRRTTGYNYRYHNHDNSRDIYIAFARVLSLA